MRDVKIALVEPLLQDAVPKSTQFGKVPALFTVLMGVGFILFLDRVQHRAVHAQVQHLHSFDRDGRWQHLAVSDHAMNISSTNTMLSARAALKTSLPKFAGHLGLDMATLGKPGQPLAIPRGGRPGGSRVNLRGDATPPGRLSAQAQAQTAAAVVGGHTDRAAAGPTGRGLGPSGVPAVATAPAPQFDFAAASRRDALQQVLFQRSARAAPPTVLAEEFHTKPAAAGDTPQAQPASPLTSRREKLRKARSRRDMLIQGGAALGWLQNPVPNWLERVARSEAQATGLNATAIELPVPLLIETRA